MSTATAEPTPSVPDRLVSIKELATILAIPLSTARHLRLQGQLGTPLRIGRHLRWRPDQVRALIGREQ
jgi:hypothetical protein